MPTGSATRNQPRPRCYRASCKQSDAPRALDVFRQGRAIIAQLAKQSPDNGQLSKDLAAFDDEILSRSWSRQVFLTPGL